MYFSFYWELRNLSLIENSLEWIKFFNYYLIKIANCDIINPCYLDHCNTDYSQGYYCKFNTFR